MNKECLYERCEHHFQGNNKIYEKCPECGAGSLRFTEPTMLKEHKEIVDSSVPYGYIKSHQALIYATKCPHAIDCYFYGHYKPSCEDMVFSLDCLIPMATELSAAHQKLDKILNLLELKNP